MKSVAIRFLLATLGGMQKTCEISSKSHIFATDKKLSFSYHLEQNLLIRQISWKHCSWVASAYQQEARGRTLIQVERYVRH